MWLVVTILASGGLVSAVWLLAAVGMHLVGRVRGRASGSVTSNIKRAATMTVACAACASAVHLAMSHIESFASQMPAALLRLDVSRPWYGRTALNVLADRAAQHTLSFESAAEMTETLLGSDWWIDETMRQRFDPSRPPERWLTIQMEQGRLGDDQLARWLNLVPPPMFLANADTRQSPSSIKLAAVFGREWQRIDRVPYRVNRLEVVEIRLNGEPQEFTVEEAEDSHAEIGWYANRVAYDLLGLHAPAQGGPRCEIEIIYRLDLEPSSYTNIGPLSWKTTLLVN